MRNADVYNARGGARASDTLGACVRLADGLERGPGVRPADLQRRFVVEDVVAELLQRRLRIRHGELSRVLHLLTNGHVDLLREQKSGVSRGGKGTLEL